MFAAFDGEHEIIASSDGDSRLYISTYPERIAPGLFLSLVKFAVAFNSVIKHGERFMADGALALSRQPSKFSICEDSTLAISTPLSAGDHYQMECSLDVECR